MWLTMATVAVWLTMATTVLQCVAVCCSVADYGDCVEVFTHSNSVTSEQYQRVAVCCGAVCCVAVCCNVRFDH